MHARGRILLFFLAIYIYIVLAPIASAYGGMRERLLFLVYIYSSCTYSAYGGMRERLLLLLGRIYIVLAPIARTEGREREREISALLLGFFLPIACMNECARLLVAVHACARSYGAAALVYISAAAAAAACS